MASQNSDEFLVERTTIVKAEAPVVFRVDQRFPSVDSVVAVGRSSTRRCSVRTRVLTRASGLRTPGRETRRAGSGSMVITESVPNERVVLDLAFLKPFKAQNVTTFLILAEFR